MDRNKLIGWLCIWRLQHGSPNDGRMCVPTKVRLAWIAAGWVEETGDRDRFGYCHSNLTDAGMLVTDLSCPEWGIDPLPVE